MADADLLGAAELGDHDALLKALADGANVNATDPKDKKGKTASTGRPTAGATTTCARWWRRRPT